MYQTCSTWFAVSEMIQFALEEKNFGNIKSFLPKLWVFSRNCKKLPLKFLWHNSPFWWSPCTSTYFVPQQTHITRFRFSKPRKLLQWTYACFQLLMHIRHKILQLQLYPLILLTRLPHSNVYLPGKSFFHSRSTFSIDNSETPWRRIAKPKIKKQKNVWNLYFYGFICHYSLKHLVVTELHWFAPRLKGLKTNIHTYIHIFVDIYI